MLVKDILPSRCTLVSASLKRSRLLLYAPHAQCFLKREYFFFPVPRGISLNSSWCHSPLLRETISGGKGSPSCRLGPLRSSGVDSPQSRCQLFGSQYWSKVLSCVAGAQDTRGGIPAHVLRSRVRSLWRQNSILEEKKGKRKGTKNAA